MRDTFWNPSWQSRGWSWVDPTKEVKAHKDAVDSGFMSPQDAISEQGREYTDVYREIAEAQEKREELGIVLPTDQPMEEEEEEDDDEDEEKITMLPQASNA